MARTIGIASNKGGTGKTTTAINLGYSLTEQGKRVVLVDGDPQQSLTTSFHHANRAQFGLTQLMLNGDFEDCITTTNYPGLDIVVNDDPGSENDGVVSNFLRRASSHHALLGTACEALEEYDFIIIDSQGAHHTFQESLIYASDMVLTPVAPNYLDMTELMSGLLPRLSQLLPIRENLPTISGRPFPPAHVLINMRRKNFNDQEKIESFLRNEFPQIVLEDYPRLDIQVLDSVIYDRVNFNKALGQGVPAASLDRSDAALSINNMMESLIFELFPDIKEEAEASPLRAAQR